jgi:hypothetical protein
MATPQTAAPTSAYTPVELAYLLAGRTGAGPELARRHLRLRELKEGDPEVPAAVQSMSARGLVSVKGDDVQIENAAKVVGFVLGTADDWTRIIAATDSQTDVIFVVSSPDVPSALVVRVTPLGTFDIVATRPGVHRSQVAGQLSTVYLQNFDEVGLSVDRSGGGRDSEIRVERIRSEGVWRLHRRRGLATPDVLDEPVETDEKQFLADLEQLLA